MKSAEACRTLAAQYREKAETEGVSPKMAEALRAIANSFATLATQFEIMANIAGDEKQAVH